MLQWLMRLPRRSYNPGALQHGECAHPGTNKEKPILCPFSSCEWHPSPEWSLLARSITVLKGRPDMHTWVSTPPLPRVGLRRPLDRTAPTRPDSKHQALNSCTLWSLDPQRPTALTPAPAKLRTCQVASIHPACMTVAAPVLVLGTWHACVCTRNQGHVCVKNDYMEQVQA